MGAVEDMVCVVCVWLLQREHSGDGCDLASTLCKYDLRMGDLFVLSWARVRRMRRGSLSPMRLMFQVMAYPDFFYGRICFTKENSTKKNRHIKKHD